MFCKESQLRTIVKTIGFTSQAFIEFIECNNPEYFSLL